MTEFYPNRTGRAIPTYNLFGRRFEMDYMSILSNYDLTGYNHIALYGMNDCAIKLIELIEELSGNPISYICDPLYKYDCFFGMKICKSLDDIADTIDCLIINVKRCDDDIRYELIQNLYDFAVIDLYDVDRFVAAFHHPELEKLKGIGEKKRCFIIGNGPSLTIKDLDTLHTNDEICFGANFIYRVYDRTKWRANYICVSDDRMIDMIDDEGWDIIKNTTEDYFIGDTYHIIDSPGFYSGRHYVHVWYGDVRNNHPAFSDDIVLGTYQGQTVTYDLELQIAAYMGFDEIYLLGCDNTGASHFIENYYSGDEEKRINGDPMLFSAIKAYESANIYSKRKGFKIYNATRGGELEVFERVDFDSLFS